MPRNFTVLDLITKGRRRCDQENRDLLSAAEWKEELSTIKSEFDGVLIDSGMRYFEKTDVLTTVAGTDTYQVPQDLLALVGVDYLQSDDQRIELEPLLAQERNYFSGSVASGQSIGYEFIGQNITFRPGPSSGDTYYVVYVPQPLDISLANDNDLIDVAIPAGEAFFVWSLALVGGIKEESEMVPFYDTKIAQYRQQVQTWATQRELYTPKRRFTHGSPGSRGSGFDDGYLPGDFVR